MADRRRKWLKTGPHEYTLRMGPLDVEVSRWGPIANDPALWRDEWGYRVVLRAKFGGVEIAQGHAVGNGAPLVQCQADAIAAVERWRDSIR